jgi:hypothetical protein
LELSSGDTSETTLSLTKGQRRLGAAGAKLTRHCGLPASAGKRMLTENLNDFRINSKLAQLDCSTGRHSAADFQVTNAQRQQRI